MNWHMIISGLIVVVLKIVGMTFFLLYFPQIFGEHNVSFSPTERPGTVPQIFGSSNVSFTPTESFGTVCPTGWDFHQGRCFFLSTSENSWNNSMNFCKQKGSTLAIVNTPEKLKFLQNISGAEKYFIGLLYQPAEKMWRWINNSVFNGSVISHSHNFNCVTIGLTKTFDAASCDVNYRSICEKSAQ
ncbi:C-type lectin domain family 5 member A isoform X1 [Sus scrofa]|uniref:C-type lectin domain family 5 member A n=1 Tax=Sus scrofa TaxID=9823 RepID=CLC5A_PIG|nr:C-type lectin domain family 5 member A [Sus scrofa]XP_005657788.2 C-type lectin domain family 5 member A isoform X1 [Sus scrofa]Q9GLF3.1 RecName: Full=C-type lectin domain family 5 member A; AltName: Full=C-type lectin superfamily member 5; AltName: Full=Myeloid DAP12-associating lectin 1; Short=MDL-1 [Sus scrofa]AAG29428.1 myeloid DAP12-associating lectin long form [Sus scrofa]